MTDPIQPTPTQPTTPVQPPASPTPETMDSDVLNTIPSTLDLMYMMACYCYIHASEIGAAALRDLNPSLVVLDSLQNPDVLSSIETTTANVKSTEQDEEKLQSGMPFDDITRDVL